MSTEWTFLCNIESLSKVTLWVSFEPYRSVFMCLLLSRYVSVPTIQYVPTIKPEFKKTKTNTTQIFRAYSQKITSSLAWHCLQDRKIMVVHLSLPIVVFYKEMAVLPSWRPSIITDDLPHSSRSFFDLVMAFMKVEGCAHTKPTTDKKAGKGVFGLIVLLYWSPCWCCSLRTRRLCICFLPWCFLCGVSRC